MDDYQTFIHRSRYARFLKDKGRRETYPETVRRYFDFLDDHLRDNFGDSTADAAAPDLTEIRKMVENMDVVPSMRAMMTAGEAAKRDNTCIYNCAYIAIDSPYAFDEALFVLMCGTGIGYSVERQYVNKLPEVPENLRRSDTIIAVEDSKEGWARALRQLISLLYSGEMPSYDTSRVRPAGAELKTFGGRSSGPEPLEELFDFVIETFRNAAGRKLTSIEAHDIMCKIGEIVVVGGVRRSAMISLSNLSDDRMRKAKSGAWWETTPYRALANNSWVADEAPEVGAFMNEWISLYESKSGERGIFSRESCREQAKKIGRDPNHEFGTNPCSEIILRSMQFCNLTEIVVREGDTVEDLQRKAWAATVLGTIQSTMTNFPYLRREWKQNCQEERLLGVSMTGIMDNPLTAHNTDELKNALSKTRDHARLVNQNWAEFLGINESASISCIKPSGTVSQLVDAASGIHPRYAHQYIRTVRADNKDPMTQFLKDQGVPHEPCFMKPQNTTVFSFVQTSPDSSVCRNDRSAIDQLELWKTYQEYWCEHKPSITVYVRENEWPRVGAWVWDHFDYISGISFLPHTDHVYKQAPYQEVDDQEWNAVAAQMPERIAWEYLGRYENGDNTAGSQTLACSGDSCEVVDLTQ